LAPVDRPLLLDPDSEESRQLVTVDLGLTDGQYRRLRELAHLVCDWNGRVNLVSRRDCSPRVVWTRHVLPSVSAAAAAATAGDGSLLPIGSARTAVDVGTGGGFPGLPLAVALPSTQFLLVDSVGKKLAAVRDMAGRLGLTNVRVHHGRVEDLDPGRKFDVATGRSVSSLPQFCTWMRHLVGSDGHLMYWTGSSGRPQGGDPGEAVCAGDGIPGEILALCDSDVAIEPLLRHLVPTDKRILTFDRGAVQALAAMNGGRPRAATRASSKVSAPTPRPSSAAADREGKEKLQLRPRSQRSARGRPKSSSKARPSPSGSRSSWRRASSGDESGQRGYDDFPRYQSGSDGSRPK
jgi:16S rRNA (guanine(527)-N(7))-methyltransferase RsmG